MEGVHHFGDGFSFFEVFGLSVFEVDVYFSFEHDGEGGGGVEVPGGLSAGGDFDEEGGEFGLSLGIGEGGAVPGLGGFEEGCRGDVFVGIEGEGIP